MKYKLTNHFEWHSNQLQMDMTTAPVSQLEQRLYHINAVLREVPRDVLATEAAMEDALSRLAYVSASTDLGGGDFSSSAEEMTPFHLSSSSSNNKEKDRKLPASSRQAYQTWPQSFRVLRDDVTLYLEPPLLHQHGRTMSSFEPMSVTSPATTTASTSSTSPQKASARLQQGAHVDVIAQVRSKVLVSNGDSGQD